MAIDACPAYALVLDGVVPGLTVVHHWDTYADVLEIISGPVNHTFTPGTKPVTTLAFEVKRRSDGDVHFRSLYFRG